MAKPYGENKYKARSLSYILHTGSYTCRHTVKEYSFRGLGGANKNKALDSIPGTVINK